MDKKRFLFLGIAVAALLTGSIFAATTGEGQLSLTTGSSLPGGGLADVTPLAESFTLTQGNAQKVAGVELHRIDLGSSTIRNQIRVHASLLNPGDMSKVLNNPNSWVEVFLAYRVSSGEDFTLSTGEKVKIASLRVGADNHMTRENGSVALLPEMGGDEIDSDTYWVLGTIKTPGGAPPGQQEQVGFLRFHVEVRK